MTHKPHYVKDEHRTWFTNDCPSGKRCYPSRKVARAHARTNRQNGIDLLSAYKCPKCGEWHLGHLPPEVKKGITERWN